jgi:hypothetical protein
MLLSAVTNSPTRSSCLLCTSGHRLLLKTWYCCWGRWWLVPAPLFSGVLGRGSPKMPLLASLWGPETHSPLFSIFFPSHREWVPSFQLKQSDAVPEGWGAVWSCFLSGDLAHFSTQWLLQPPPRQAKEALLRGQLAGMAFILILGLVTVRQVCVSLGGSPLVFVQF